jgi:hypothetical protein
MVKDGKQELEWLDWRDIIWCLRNIADEYGYDLRPLAHS